MYQTIERAIASRETLLTMAYRLQDIIFLIIALLGASFLLPVIMNTLAFKMLLLITVSKMTYFTVCYNFRRAMKDS